MHRDRRDILTFFSSCYSTTAKTEYYQRRGKNRRRRRTLRGRRGNETALLRFWG